MNITYTIRFYRNCNLLDIESDLTLEQMLNTINKYNNEDIECVIYTIVNGVFASKDTILLKELL